jgi:hypothetical protein
MPEAGGAHLGERMPDTKRGGEAFDILRRIVAADAGETLGVIGGSKSSPTETDHL